MITFFFKMIHSLRDILRIHIVWRIEYFFGLLKAHNQ